MVRRIQAYRLSSTDNPKDVETWNRRFDDIDRRLSAHDDSLDDVDAVARRIEGVALDRINNVVTPLVVETQGRVREIAELFHATSMSAQVIGTGTKTFIIPPDQRNTFAAIQWVCILVSGDQSQGMLGKVISLDRDTGELLVQIASAHGIGAHESWDIFIAPPPDLGHGSRTDNPHATSAAQVGAYSIGQTDAAIQAANSALKGAPPVALDTLQKLSGALGNDPAYAVSVATSLAHRLRIDADTQSLTPIQKSNGRANLGLGDMALADQATFIKKVGGVFDGDVTFNGAAKFTAPPVNAWPLTGGVGNAFTAAYSVSPATYSDGQTFNVVADRAASGGDTFQVNGLAVKQIKRQLGGGVLAPIQMWDWRTADRLVLCYSEVAGCFVLLSPSVGVAPIGSLIITCGYSSPAGYLYANGALVSRAAYANLFVAIGTVYGAGDGATTFAIPDLRGEFIRGWDNGRGIDPGRVFGSGQGDAIRNISGYLAANSYGGGSGGAIFRSWAGGSTSAGGSGSNNLDSTFSFDASRTVPTAAENRPRNIALNFFIKY